MKRLSENQQVIDSVRKLNPQPRLPWVVDKALRKDAYERFHRMVQRMKGRDAPEPRNEGKPSGYRTIFKTRTAQIVRKVRRGRKVFVKIEERKVQEADIRFFFWHDPVLRDIFHQAKQRERKAWKSRPKRNRGKHPAAKVGRREHGR